MNMTIIVKTLSQLTNEITKCWERRLEKTPEILLHFTDQLCFGFRITHKEELFRYVRTYVHI